MSKNSDIWAHEPVMKSNAVFNGFDSKLKYTQKTAQKPTFSWYDNRYLLLLLAVALCVSAYLG